MTSPISASLKMCGAKPTSIPPWRAAGATILKPGTETLWGGYTGYFADPDGFAWEVAWNPGFEILPDGGIKLPT
jgi:hypothetical protein